MTLPSSNEVNQTNSQAFDESGTVTHYAALDFLFDTEAYIFPKYITANQRLLDVGVGGGRTTANLAHVASYVGVDLSPRMIEACRKRFPKLKFEVVNAAEPLPYENASFDCVLFSFNGLGYLYPDLSRKGFLNEANRVLAKDGLLILSLHHPDELIRLPDLKSADPLRIMWRLARSLAISLKKIVSAPFSRGTWTGSKWIFDSAHGGLFTYHVRPELFRREAEAAGFQLIEWMPAPKASSSRIFRPWIYYVLKKKGQPL